MDRQNDPTVNTKPYILASFGSAWVCLRVRISGGSRISYRGHQPSTRPFFCVNFCFLFSLEVQLFTRCTFYDVKFFWNLTYAVSKYFMKYFLSVWWKQHVFRLWIQCICRKKFSWAWMLTNRSKGTSIELDLSQGNTSLMHSSELTTCFLHRKCQNSVLFKETFNSFIFFSV